MPHGQLNYDQIRSGSVALKAANYTVVESDAFKLLAFNPSGSPLTTYTATLPAAPSGLRSATWWVAISNYGGGIVTISPNGKNLDGAAGSLSLTAGESVVVQTDGTNYFTRRGIGGSSLLLQTNGANNGNQTKLNLVAGTNVTLTDSGTGNVTVAASGGAAAALVLLTSSSPSGTGTVTFSSISGSYTDLILVVRAASTVVASNDTMTVQFNNDTAAHYNVMEEQATSNLIQNNSTVLGTSINLNNVPGSTAPSNSVGFGEYVCYGYAQTTFNKVLNFIAGFTLGAGAANLFQKSNYGEWQSTAAITRIDVKLGTGNFVSGSVVSLYGRT